MLVAADGINDHEGALPPHHVLRGRHGAPIGPMRQPELADFAQQSAGHAGCILTPATNSVRLLANTVDLATGCKILLGVVVELETQSRVGLSMAVSPASTTWPLAAQSLSMLAASPGLLLMSGWPSARYAAGG